MSFDQEQKLKKIDLMVMTILDIKLCMLDDKMLLYCSELHPVPRINVCSVNLN